MDNHALAELFEELADLLALQDENPFKVRAYRRAADTLRGLDTPASELVGQRRLGELEGFGEAIVAKVEAALAEGTFPALEAARETVGMDVRGLGRVPGLGPKVLVALRDELGVRTLADLEAAAARGRIAKVTGIGDKLEARIKAALPLVRSSLTAVRLDEARALVGKVLARADGTLALGELRRWMPLVHGVSIAAPSDPKGAPSSVHVHRLDPARDGRRIVELTGPDEHVAALRERAAEAGLLWAALQGTEAAVYEALGLAWVPPECRDDPRALERAAGEGFDDLVTLGSVRADLQVHTTFSDGHASPREMARAAAALGHTTVGFTDHAGHEGIPSALEEDGVDAYVAAVHEAGDEAGIQTLAGAEVEVSRTGELTLADEALERLDYVAAGIHLALDLAPELQTARYLAVVEHPLVSMVVHPMGRKVGKRPGARLDVDRVFAAAAEHDVVLEIDAHPARLDLDATLVRKAVAAGCDIAIDTDAHAVAELGLLEYGVMTARKALVPADRVVNTWAPDRLAARLAC